MSRINSQGKVEKRISSNKPKLPVISIVIAITVIVCIIAGIAAYLILGAKKMPIDADSYNLVVTQENVDEILAKMSEAEKTPIGSYEVYMNTEWTFPDSVSPATDAILRNNLTNSNTVYCTIVLRNSGEQIYKSPYVPVGSSLKNIVLDSQLSAGEYACVITYHLVDDSFAETSNVSVNMNITIQK